MIDAPIVEQQERSASSRIHAEAKGFRRPSGRHANLDYRIIIPRLEAGETPSQLAREFGCSQSAISQGARSKGWAGMRKRIDYFAVMYRLENGEKPIDLAREYGCARQAIYRGAKRHGWIFKSEKQVQS